MAVVVVVAIKPINEEANVITINMPRSKKKTRSLKRIFISCIAIVTIFCILFFYSEVDIFQRILVRKSFEHIFQ